MCGKGLRIPALIASVGILVAVLIHSAGVISSWHVRQGNARAPISEAVFMGAMVAQRVHSNAAEYNINLTNISYDISGKAILFCNSTTPASMKLLYRGNASGMYVINVNDILRYVYGTKLEGRVAKKLHNARWVVLAAKCGLQKPLAITRKGSTVFIYVRAKDCTVRIPVVVDIYGKVYIKNVSNKYIVNIVINLSMPLDADARRLFSLMNASCIPRRIALRLFEGSALTLHERWVLSPENGYAHDTEGKTHCARSGPARWKTPLIILFPKNANELKEVIERGIMIKYLNTTLKFTMMNISVLKAHYGKPARWITVPLIKALYTNQKFYAALRQAILPLTRYPIKLNVSLPVLRGRPFELLIGGRGDLSTVYDVIVDALVNGSVDIDGYENSYLRTSVYRIILFNPVEPPSLLYRYMYPISFNYFPVIVSINNSKLLLGLKADAVYPPWFDPYAINIGFYRVQGQGRSKYTRLALTLLPICVAFVVFVVYMRKRARTDT